MGANIDAIIDGVSGDILVDACFSSYSQAPEDHVTPTNFADELIAFLDRHKICASDYVYLHMPYSTLIAGVLQVVATSRVEDLPVFLIRICSVDNSFRWHDIRQTSCVRAIAELGGDRRKRIRLFVESLPLQRYFEEAAGQTLPVLLNPVFGSWYVPNWPLPSAFVSARRAARWYSATSARHDRKKGSTFCQASSTDCSVVMALDASSSCCRFRPRRRMILTLSDALVWNWKALPPLTSPALRSRCSAILTI